MKQRNKKLIALIAIIIMVTILAIETGPNISVNAAVNKYISYPYVNVAMSTIGIGQTELLIFWTADMPVDIGEITAQSGRAAWYNVEFKVTDPDGQNKTIVIPTSDAIGGGWTNYVPETVGVYSVQVHFPAQWRNTTANQYYYSEAWSPPVTFTAQTEQMPTYNESPLPDGYWSRPINQAARQWYVLGGNWLSGAHEQPAGRQAVLPRDGLKVSDRKALTYYGQSHTISVVSRKDGSQKDTKLDTTKE